MRKRRKNHINPLKWIGWLFSPILNNGAFFVFMFALGWLCTQLEIMPYYLRDRGAKPYELSAPELFLDIYAVCALLMLIPRKIRIFFKALIYIFLYGLAIVDMYCYVRFESTWILLLILAHFLWTVIRLYLGKMHQRMVLPKVNDGLITGLKAVMGCVVAWMLFSAISQTWDNKVAMHRLFTYNTIGEVEHELTRKDQAKLYVPVYRLAFGVYVNRLASKQIVQLKAASRLVQVDSCRLVRATTSITPSSTAIRKRRHPIR